LTIWASAVSAPTACTMAHFICHGVALFSTMRLVAGHPSRRLRSGCHLRIRHSGMIVMRLGDANVPRHGFARAMKAALLDRGL
jgi:hypothetical protein